MSDRWKLTYEVIPYSVDTKDREASDKGCGDRRQTYEFHATSFAHAYDLTYHFMVGVKRNGWVWEADIISLEKLSRG